MNIEEMLQSYLVCALWSSTGDDDEPLDSTHGVNDIAPESVESARIACMWFVDRMLPWLGDWDAGQAGHDLWLTRNGHGTGFWDRGREHGKRLSDFAHSMGKSDAYIGDDGKVYLG